MKHEHDPSAPGDRQGHGPQDRDGARRIVVVDDHLDSADSLAAILRRDGNEALVATTAQAGLRLARDLRPAVVISDLGLPDMHGCDLARRLRSEYGADVRLIAVSGSASPEAVSASLEAGFDVHLAKPVDFVRLRELIEQD